jgi:polyhydroxyalkanoate synthesis repressor PhaR
MPVIKRYANRKLYDTESRHYVTLEDLADFIRRGEDVQVIDHVSGEDLTSVTLVQVIFEEEKKIGGLLPQVFLTRLIRAGGQTVNALRGRLASIDPLNMVDEEIRRRLAELVERGRIAEEEALRIEELLLRETPQAASVQIPVIDEDARAAEVELADPAEVDALQEQVTALEQELERLKQSSM